MEFIDWARGLAIVTVLLFHSTLVLSEAMHWRGYLWDPTALAPGVSILNVALQWFQTPSMFFVISGYLVHRSMARHPGHGAGMLLLRRGLRLYVPYLAALVFYAVIWPRTRLEATYEGAVDALAHLLLIHNFNNDTIWSINASFWYVAVELQLCALYPLVIAATRRFGWNRTLLVLLAIELGTRLIGSIIESRSVQGDLVYSLWMRWPGAFALTWYLGAWIAELQRTGALRQPSLGMTVGLPALGTATVLAWPLSGFSPSVMGMSYAAWLAWLVCRTSGATATAKATAARGTSGSGEGPLITRLGSLTLGIYLLNQPLIIELSYRLARWLEIPILRVAATAAVALVILLPAAWLMARTIEQPLTRLLDSWLDAMSRRQLPAKAKAPVRA